MIEISPREWFDRYIAAFNESDFDTLAAYYAPDIQFQGRAASFSSAVEVIEFYRTVKTRITETLEVLSFVDRPGRIAVELRTTLEPFADWIDFPTGPLLKGERRSSVNFIFYDIADGRFTRVRSAAYRGAA